MFYNVQIYGEFIYSEELSGLVLGVGKLGNCLGTLHKEDGDLRSKLKPI